jgi:hypothetical protein
MATLFRTRFLFPFAGVVAAFAWAACGGGTAGSEFSGPDGTDSGPPVDDPDTGTFIPFGSPDSGAGSTPGGSAFDPGPLVLVDGGTEFEGGVECWVGGEVEQEPNDTKATANVLKTARCGEVLPGTESDWLTFEIDDASTTGLTVYYEGPVHVFVETAGMPPTDISNPNQPIVLARHQPYYVEVRSLDGKSQNWRVALHEDGAK